MAGAIDTSPGRGIAARIAGLAQTVGRDPVLLRRGRTLDTICQLNIGNAMLLLRIIDGNIVELREGPFVTPSADFAISGDAAVWQRFLAADPPPGDHFPMSENLALFLSYLEPVLGEIAARG